MSGFVLRKTPLGARSGPSVCAREMEESWIVRCSCGFESQVNFLKALPVTMSHVRSHWLDGLMAWNLTLQ